MILFYGISLGTFNYFARRLSTAVFILHNLPKMMSCSIMPSMLADGENINHSCNFDLSMQQAICKMVSVRRSKLSFSSYR